MRLHCHSQISMIDLKLDKLNLHVPFQTVCLPPLTHLHTPSHQPQLYIVNVCLKNALTLEDGIICLACFIIHYTTYLLHFFSLNILTHYQTPNNPSLYLRNYECIPYVTMMLMYQYLDIPINCTVVIFSKMLYPYVTIVLWYCYCRLNLSTVWWSWSSSLPNPR